MKKLIALSVLPFALVACGGGSSEESNEIPEPSTTAPSETTPLPDESSSTAITVKQGVITGFGSVYLDGKRYLTDNANIIINGIEGQAIDQLKVGMTINLISENGDDTPNAQRIEYDSGVEGVVQSIDRVNRIIYIAGVEVFYNDLTHFIATSSVSLSVGERVEVSGYPLAGGQFQATYIGKELDNDGQQSEHISGLIQNLDTGQQKFSIGNVTVDYSSARVEGVISNQILVKVEGMTEGSNLIASEVEVKGYHDDNYDEAEVEGVITAYDNNAGIVEVNGQQFELSSSVSFSNGSSLDLITGAQVELKLSIVNGGFTVTHIEFKHFDYYNDGVMKGAIAAIDYSAKSLTIGSNTYFANSQTHYEDEYDQYFSFDSLQLNEFIEVVYVTEGTQNVILKVEREREDERFEESEIKGQITSFTSSSIVVAGLSIDLPADALYFIDDTRSSLAQFVSNVTNGLYVEVSGTFDANGLFLPTKFELEFQGDDGNDDDDRDDGSRTGHVELEGRVTAILSDTSFMLNSYTIELKEATKLELYDRRVSLVEFMNAVQVNQVVEIEGSWITSTAINAYEAEIDND